MSKKIIYIFLILLILTGLLITTVFSQTLIADDSDITTINSKTSSLVPHGYWLAECQKWPFNKGVKVGDYTIVESQNDIKIWVLLESKLYKLVLTGKQLKTYESGWFLYNLYGPLDIYNAMYNMTECRNVTRYKDVYTDFNTDMKEWITDYSVCHGEAVYTHLESKQTWDIQKWPCYWGRTRNNKLESFTIKSTTALSPGITNGQPEEPAMISPMIDAGVVQQDSSVILDGGIQKIDSKIISIEESRINR